MVEGARLESVCASDRTAGSNPVLSAKKNRVHLDSIFLARVPGYKPAGASLLARPQSSRTVKSLILQFLVDGIARIAIPSCVISFLSAKFSFWHILAVLFDGILINMNRIVSISLVHIVLMYCLMVIVIVISVATLVVMNDRVNNLEQKMTEQYSKVESSIKKAQESVSECIQKKTSPEYPLASQNPTLEIYNRARATC